MRQLLLVCLLMFPCISKAGQPTLVTIPYTPVLTDKISLDDDKVCQKQAQFGAVALQNARRGELLSEQMILWDEFESSEDSAGYSEKDLIFYRGLINIAWQLAERHPELTPNDFGDQVYASCAYQKIPKTVTF